MDPSRFSPSAPGTLVAATDAHSRRGKAFLPDLLPPKVDFGSRELRLALSEADRELTRLNGIARNIVEPETLFATLLRREAVLSSAIEGSHRTLEDLILFEATKKYRTADDRHVENYVKASDYGRHRAREIAVGIRLFCELHHILMQNTDAERTTPGRTRDLQVFIGQPTFRGARFIPPPHVFVPALLENLRDYSQTEPGAKLIAVAHYQFEVIHPFRDGNGRVGRMLISHCLQREAVLTVPLLSLSAYFEQRRTAYYDALLSVSTNGACESWVLFFLRGVAMQSRDAWRRVQQLASLREDYKRRLSGPRATVNTEKLVHKLFAIPTLSVHAAMTHLNGTFATAKASIEELMDAGILEREPFLYHGTHYYFARELIALVDAPLGESRKTFAPR